MTAPALSDLARAFDLMDIREASLSAWAPVHQARTREGLVVVVKRTAPSAQRAAAMADWTRALVETGLPVVAPAPLGDANPAQVGDDWWVVYPYLQGRAYEANDAGDVHAAGDLLGRLHSAPVNAAVLNQLRPYEWPDTSREDVEADLSTLDTIAATYLGGEARAASAELHALANRWWTNSLPRLRAADSTMALPRRGVSSDYKATNLVFNQAGTPTLIDPDNGGLEPRLFDLAMTVVLFHNECDTAPGRLFTAQEWRIFITAYLGQVDLTPQERELWPAALDHMLWEEGSWVLEDSDADAWADTRQGAYLADLAMTQPGRYPMQA